MGPPVGTAIAYSCLICSVFDGSGQIHSAKVQRCSIPWFAIDSYAYSFARYRMPDEMVDALLLFFFPALRSDALQTTTLNSYSRKFVASPNHTPKSATHERIAAISLPALLL